MASFPTKDNSRGDGQSRRKLRPTVTYESELAVRGEVEKDFRRQTFPRSQVLAPAFAEREGMRSDSIHSGDANVSGWRKSVNIFIRASRCPGGETRQTHGLKIPSFPQGTYRFDSGPGHQPKVYAGKHSELRSWLSATPNSASYSSAQPTRER